MKQRPNIMMYCSPACCILMLAGLLALSSCSSYEDEGTARAKGDVTLSFAMAVDGGATTRSMKGDATATALTAYWEEGEQVTVGITHDGTTTYKEATVNQISNDKKRAYVSMTVDADKVATGDKMTVVYPAIDIAADGSISKVFNFTKQDGSLNGDLGVSQFDLRHGESTLVVDGTTATLAADLGLVADLTAYIGVKCLDSEGNEIAVKQMTVRPADSYDGSATWLKWRTRASFGSKVAEQVKSIDYYAGGELRGGNTYTEYWGGIIATRDKAGTDRTFIAMPTANSGQRMTFTAITEDDKVYALTKTWTGEAGDYYPVTMKMEKVLVPDHVDLGLSVEWSTWDIGLKQKDGTFKADSAGYYAYGEISVRKGTNPRGLYFQAGWPWYYEYITTPYQMNPDNKPTVWNTKYISADYPDDIIYLPYYRDTDWRKYGGYGDRKTLEACDDAATMTYGSSWRMPTYEEQKELQDNCTWTFGDLSFNVKHNDKSISFVYIGFKHTNWYFGNAAGPFGRTEYRWSSSLYYDDDEDYVFACFAYELSLRYGRQHSASYTYSCYGCPIRPVYTNKAK